MEAMPWQTIAKACPLSSPLHCGSARSKLAMVAFRKGKVPFSPHKNWDNPHLAKHGRILGHVLPVLIAATLGLLGGTVQAAGEAESVTDIVFALDVSLSMQEDNRFGKIRDRLIEFIQDEIDLDTNVAVVTFGEDARLVARQMVKNDADKAVLIAQLKQMKANAEGTYIAGGIDISLQELRTLRRQQTGRMGILVMLTDGKNEPPPNIPLDQQVTFQKLREKYANLADFKPTKDWFFWYCFIGDADKEVREFTESFGGESKPVTGPWKFLKVRFSRGLVKLSDVSPGDWTLEYPAAADRQLGDVLSVSTRNPGQYDLQISDVVLDERAARGAHQVWRHSQSAWTNGNSQSCYN